MAVCSSSFNLSSLANNPSNQLNSSLDQWSCNFALPPFVLSHSTSQLKPSFKIVANLGVRMRQNDAFIVKVSTSDDPRVLDDASSSPKHDHGGSGDGDDGFPPENGGGGGGGGGGGDEGDDADEKEFGPIMKFEDVVREIEKVGANLPEDIMEAAKTTGIRKLLLMRYLELQGAAGPLGFLMRHCPMLRNRMLADPAFLFKVGTEKFKRGEKTFGTSLNCT